MMKETDILYSNGQFWVRAAEFGSGRFKPKSKGYEVWEDGITHATCQAKIGFAGEEGLKRAIAETDERAKASVGQLTQPRTHAARSAMGLA